MEYTFENRQFALTKEQLYIIITKTLREKMLLSPDEERKMLEIIATTLKH